MVVLSVTNCPQQLRGDLTKWLIEIDIGVYVGRLSARVRDKLWERVCDNIRAGKAIMVFTSNTEQGFQIQTHNTDWIPVQCEGLWMMQKPCSPVKSTPFQKETSKLVQQLYQKRPAVEKKKNYIILDIETTGLDYSNDTIIEIGMLKVVDNMIVDEFQVLLNPHMKLSAEVIRLTGITQEMLEEKGVSASEAIDAAADFTGNNLVVGYNLDFDLKFISKLCDEQNAEKFIYRSKDILRMIKRKLITSDYRLSAVAEKCQVDSTNAHRALEDCRMLYGIINKLNIF